MPRARASADEPRRKSKGVMAVVSRTRQSMDDSERRFKVIDVSSLQALLHTYIHRYVPTYVLTYILYVGNTIIKVHTYVLMYVLHTSTE